MRDAAEFVESVKVDLFADEVFVFSPKGDVYDLPRGSTPIDFAYRVHSAIGNRMNGARVNGRIVPIAYNLQNGDMVEIITSSTVHGPSRDWLDIVKSSQAKSKIKQWFKRENREENIVRGKELVDKEIKRQGYTPAQLVRPDWVEQVLRRYNFSSIDDAYSAVGYDGISAIKIVAKLAEEYREANKGAQVTDVKSLQESAEEQSQKAPQPPLKKPPENGILVKGIDNCLVRLSRCCNPVPGDDIIGYVTRARGVSVHRVDCPNVIHEMDDDDRIIEVSWYDGKTTESYPAAVAIVAHDRQGLLSDITGVVNSAKITMSGVRANISKDNNYAMVTVTLQIAGKDQLDMIIRRLRVIESVINVTRGSA
jgi:GTP pyrophosphokinase